MTKKSSDDQTERLLIREAMQRLLDGEPLRSDGKLTVKSLADEAGLKRWFLTHKHKDLQAEFRERINQIDSMPKPMKDLHGKLEKANERRRRQATELKEAREALARYGRITHVLTLELQKASEDNLELSRRLTGSDDRTVDN